MSGPGLGVGAGPGPGAFLGLWAALINSKSVLRVMPKGQICVHELMSCGEMGLLRVSVYSVRLPCPLRNYEKHSEINLRTMS